MSMGSVKFKSFHVHLLQISGPESSHDRAPRSCKMLQNNFNLQFVDVRGLQQQQQQNPVEREVFESLRRKCLPGRNFCCCCVVVVLLLLLLFNVEQVIIMMIPDM